MSSVKHHQFSVHIEIDGVDSTRFPEAMSATIEHLLERSDEIGHTVDWSTLDVEPSEIIETRQANGDVNYLHGPLVLTVDTVTIQ